MGESAGKVTEKGREEEGTNERDAGAVIEGIIEQITDSQLATCGHGTHHGELPRGWWRRNSERKLHQTTNVRSNFVFHQRVSELAS